jgi:hypothetical protein
MCIITPNVFEQAILTAPLLFFFVLYKIDLCTAGGGKEFGYFCLQ